MVFQGFGDKVNGGFVRRQVFDVPLDDSKTHSELEREGFKSSSRESMVSSISTVEPNSLMVSIFKVKLSQKFSLMMVGNINFINFLRMMVIVAREISGLRYEFWLDKRGMLLICHEARCLGNIYSGFQRSYFIKLQKTRKYKNLGNLTIATSYTYNPTLSTFVHQKITQRGELIKF